MGARVAMQLGRSEVSEAASATANPTSPSGTLLQPGATTEPWGRSRISAPADVYAVATTSIAASQDQITMAASSSRQVD